MNPVEIVTFGCRLNAFESEAIGRAAAAAGLADAIIVNTCAVTAEAERQARQALRRARREHPGRKIIATGCAATLAPEKYAALADLVLDNEAKLRVESYGSRPMQPLTPPLSPQAGRGSAVEGPAQREGEGLVRPGRARAYLQVQQGCDHRCTFCIIPYARGPSRSNPIGAIVAEARRMVEAGCCEIVLTGVDLTAYGADLPGRPSLGQMARRLLAAVPELPRLRLSSLDPSEIDEDLWRLFAREERLMPHLHLSLQAGDDLILKRMKRRHSRADAIAVARRARELRPETAIGADLIAGFPTETDDMFRQSLDIVDECGIAFLHVFPYSPRPGTPAARMPAVAPDVVRERAARLRAAGAMRLANELGSRIGHSGNILIEKENMGRAEFYAAVALDGAAAPGTVQRMRFVGAADGKLIGAPL
jgi:threonylcarbamoyladenosine tRNA methylthiotransferase MtaB